MKIRGIKASGIVSIQVWTESLAGRPFPAWSVLIDFKEDGTFLGKPNRQELIELRRDIIANT